MITSYEKYLEQPKSLTIEKMRKKRRTGERWKSRLTDNPIQKWKKGERERKRENIRFCLFESRWVCLITLDKVKVEM